MAILISFDCQIEGIWNHPANPALRVSMNDFQNGLIEEEFASNAGCAILWDQRLNEKEKQKSSYAQLSSFLFFQSASRMRLAASCSSFHHDELYTIFNFDTK